MEGMINRTVYTINPNFRLQSNHLLVEWIHIPEHTRSLSGSLLGYKTIP